jgi:hypothetical protein
MGAGQLDEFVFEIIRAAVNLARNEQIRSLSTLRVRLATMYPGKDAECDAAIAAWAASIQERHPNGLGRSV